LQKTIIEAISPEPSNLKRDSILYRSEKVTLVESGKPNSSVHLFLFHNYLLCGKKNVVPRVKKLTKPPLKLLFIWKTHTVVVQPSKRKGLEVRFPLLQEVNKTNSRQY